MKRTLGLGWTVLTATAAAFLGCAGPAGPAGPAGTKGADGKEGAPGAPGTGTPTVSAVTPSAAFLARTLDVTVSGSGTAWSSKATVDFGAKVTVNKVTVGSETGLVVNITVAGDAAVGPRDVTVKDDAGAMETFKGAFQVTSPLKVETTGTLAQGSLIGVHARGLDFETPFDTTTTGDGFTTPIVFTGVSIPDGAGITNQVSNVGDYVLDYTMIVDVTAPAATVPLTVTSGPTGDTVDFPSGSGIVVAARAPTAFTAAAAGSAMIAKAGDSALLSYTPAAAALKIVDFAVTSADGNATPQAYFLPKSGKFADLFGSGGGVTLAVSATDPFYVIYTDGGGYAGYTATATVVETAAVGAAEKKPDNTQAHAVTNGAGVPPFVVQGSALTDQNDEAWFAVTVKAADVGKTIHAQTVGLDLRTDTVVDILDDMGNSLGGPSGDLGYLDELTSSALPAAGTYFVHVTASSVFDPAHNKYDCVIRIQ